MGQALCEGPATVLACQGGTFVEAKCGGPAGCAKLGPRVTCDDSIASAGDACLESDTENRACGADKATSLLCTKGTFAAGQVCRGAHGCQIKGEQVACDTSRALKGDTCTTAGAFACTPDMKSRVVCKGGVYALDRYCKGATGCHAADDSCDETVSDVGDPCGIDGMAACSSDGNAELICRAGAYFANRSCPKTCRATATKIECL